MSCFAGKLSEYPSFSVDCFDKNNLDSGAYFLSHCHQDHMNGMDSTIFHHELQTNRNKFVYCSETTRNILLSDERYNHLQVFLIGLPIEHPTIISFNNAKTGKIETVSVTLLSAGHCIGSVMFLFEGNAGKVLYTGDFRWSKGDAKRVSFFRYGESMKDIKSIYVDTTFYLPQMKEIPTRDSTKTAVVDLIKNWLSKDRDHYVSLLCKGMYGYEYLLKEVAMALNTKIHVSPERLSMYKNLLDLSQHFTTDSKTTRIHSCNWEKVVIRSKQNMGLQSTLENKRERHVNSRLPCGFLLPAPRQVQVLKIKATSMWFARRNEPLPSDCICQLSKNFYRVVHSMHASMNEIIDLVSHLRPLHVYPIVEPAGIYNIKETQKSLEQYTRRGDKPEKKAEKTSGDILFSCKGQKLSLAKISPRISHSPPSEEVLAQCKELGLEDESLISKPRRRRRSDRTIHDDQQNTSCESHKRRNIGCTSSEVNPCVG